MVLGASTRPYWRCQKLGLGPGLRHASEHGVPVAGEQARDGHGPDQAETTGAGDRLDLFRPQRPLLALLRAERDVCAPELRLGGLISEVREDDRAARDPAQLAHVPKSLLVVADVVRQPDGEGEVE